MGKNNKENDKNRCKKQEIKIGKIRNNKREKRKRKQERIRNNKREKKETKIGKNKK